MATFKTYSELISDWTNRGKGVIIYDNARGDWMTWFHYLWLNGEDGNVSHLAEHGLTPDDVEHVVEHFVGEATSQSSGRPLRFGFTPDGRYIAVVFEWLDEVTVYPITAYEVEE